MKPSGERPEADLGAPAPSREERKEILKSIIGELHRGGDLETARRRFAEAVGDVDASEIAAMEEELIRGGLAVSEVQRLCDVHVGAVRRALDGHAAPDVPPGHPVHTYLADNRVITGLANELGLLARTASGGSEEGPALAQALQLVERLGGIHNHYSRKENQLFPLLERHGITGPPKVMWGVHDQTRARLKDVREAVQRGDLAAFADIAPGLARDLVEMAYKEEKILFPMALQALSAEEWIEERRGEDHLGYAFARPAGPWPEGGATPIAAASAPEGGATPDGDAAAPQGLLALTTGAISLEQVNLVFRHLPVDLSFVDENDEVRFYSEGPQRIFERSPAVIGRKVQNCHPPKSVHIVERILRAFRAGEKDDAEFWIQMGDRFVHVRYFAVRDAQGAYRGCLEVTQDVTGIRALSGERRLLSWE